MKKTEPRKLTLARETVRVLDGNLQDVKGGIVSSDDQQCTYSRKCETEYPVFGNG
jgi:hypothetical protein